MTGGKICNTNSLEESSLKQTALSRCGPNTNHTLSNLWRVRPGWYVSGVLLGSSRYLFKLLPENLLGCLGRPHFCVMDSLVWSQLAAEKCQRICSNVTMDCFHHLKKLLYGELSAAMASEKRCRSLVQYTRHKPAVRSLDVHTRSVL